MEARMSDIKDLLDEAVGSYESRTDQRAVEERVERRKQRRRLAASSVALAVFVVAGWFAWTAFRPSGSTVGSAESGTYILSDFEVSAHDVDPTHVDVIFSTDWSSNDYPGAHSCSLQVLDPSGTVMGLASVEIDSLMRHSSSSMPLPVNGSTEGATAIGSCDPRRLDTPVAYDISDVQLMKDLTVSYVAGWPDGLGDGEYPGTNACTVALFENGHPISQKHSTLAVGDQQEVTSTRFNEFDDQIVLVPLASLEATVACEPYVQEGVYPDPTPPADAMEPAKVVRIDCGGEGPELLTPEVQVQNDGVLIYVEDLGDAIGVEGSLVDEDPGTGTWAFDFGEEDQGPILEVAMGIEPGRYVVRCAHGGFLAGELSAAEGESLRVIDRAAIWHDPALGCSGTEQILQHDFFGGEVSVNPSSIIDQVLRHAVPGIVDSDVIDYAEYPGTPRGQEWDFRVLRGGEVVARIRVFEAGDWTFGVEACSTSEIGDRNAPTAGPIATTHEVPGFARCDPYSSDCAQVWVSEARYAELRSEPVPQPDPKYASCEEAGPDEACSVYPDDRPLELLVTPKDRDAFVAQFGCGASEEEMCRVGV
jgi:hypothetical protein